MSDFVGFVGAAYQAPSIYQDAQECINWYPEVDNTKPAGSRGVVALYPCPGLARVLSLPAGIVVRGACTLPGGDYMLVACGDKLYLVDKIFSATEVGTLQSSSGQVGMVANGVIVYIVDGSNRYAYKISTRVLTVVSTSDGAFIGGTHCDIADGFIVYNEPNSNRWGCTGNLSGDSPQLSFSSKFSSPDYIVGLIVNKREVILIGETTTEFWINAGLFPFPFQIIPGTSFQHGCAAKYSISRLGESVAWLSQDTRGDAIVILLNGYAPDRISTHAVEFDINSGRIDDAIAFTDQQVGHEFYILVLPSQNKTWVYDLTTQLWHKRAWRDPLNGLGRIRGNCYASFQGLSLVGDFENGNLYAMRNDIYTDDGKPILRMRRAPHITKSLKRVFHRSLQIQFQPGVGNAVPPGDDPKMMLRWSNDGGATWTDYFTIAIGKIGKYKNRAIKRVLGEARDRVYEVTITDPVYAPIISAEIELEEATH